MNLSYLAGHRAALQKYAFDYEGARTPLDAQSAMDTITQTFQENAGLGEGTSTLPQPPMSNISESINPVFGTPGMVMDDSAEEKAGYDLGVKHALASFSPVPPPAATSVQSAGTPATMNSPKPTQAMATPGIKPSVSPTSTMPKPSTSGADIKPPMPAGAELPQSATAAQVATKSLQIGTQNMTTQNPAFKLGEFNSEMYPAKAKPGEIKPDNDVHLLGTNEMPDNSSSRHRVSEAFNGLKSIKPTDFLNAGNEGTVGALP